MAMDTTPRTWPMAQRGLLDDLADLIARFFKKSGAGMEPEAKDQAPGHATVNLTRGDTATLAGPAPAFVECLDGQAWVTGSGGGTDITVRTGERVLFTEPGGLAVTAINGRARVRMGWG